MTSSKFFIHGNHLSENGIALYVDALKLERLHDLPETIRLHVEQCEECKMQIMEVSQLMNDKVYDKTMKHPYFDAQEQTSSPFSIVYRIAAIFVIAAFTATTYYLLFNGASDQHHDITVQHAPNIISADSARIEKKQSPPSPTSDLFAANFEESPNLEDLVQTEFRSTTINILSPAIGEIVRTPIIFRWKQYDKPLKIKILSNKERTLVASTVRGDSFTTTKKFAPGLYYWKLETDDELLFMGKFLVK